MLTNESLLLIFGSLCVIIVFTFAIIFTFTSLHLHLYISIFTTPDIPEVYYSDGLLHGYGSPVICGGTQVYLKI